MIISAVSSIYKYRTERKSWENRGPRKYHCLAYQVSGSYDHTVLEKTISVSSDTLFFINMEDSYSVKRIAPGHSLCVTFSADLDMPTSVWDCKNDPRIYNLFIKLLQLKNLDKKSDYCLAISCIYEIFGVVYSKEDVEYMSSGALNKIKLAHDYILENYRAGEIKVNELAALSGVGEKHFRNSFHKLYGTTPTQYMINLRLNAASELLLDGRLSVSEVAEAVGISDVYYFSKLFKKRFTVSPSVFKNSRN